ncbi:MAG: DNA adenine methylase [Balneolales bacterium]
MKPPISYYGGKQRMAGKIIAMIPDHKIYTESFLGGGAVFWNKEPSDHEVINDVDDNIINFYRVLQENFDDLFGEISSTLHSRTQHLDAKYILKSEPEKLSSSYTYRITESGMKPDFSVRRAWAFWVQSNMSYSSKLYGGFAYDRSEDAKTTRAIINKREAFQLHYKERLSRVCIECNDAIKVIESRDTPYTFHYCDPPYFNSDCGHYAGYTEDDYEKLLITLSKIKGKFLLSSYPSEILDSYVNEYGWEQKSWNTSVSVSYKTSKMKTEVLTYNY